jgi:transposase InsO family protein
MHSKKMFHEVIFLRYGVPRIVISDGGSHFIDWTFWKALSKVGVDHQIATPYHPQVSGQAETSNKQIKNILQKTVNQMGRSWRSQLNEALWAMNGLQNADQSASLWKDLSPSHRT